MIKKKKKLISKTKISRVWKSVKYFVGSLAPPLIMLFPTSFFWSACSVALWTISFVIFLSRIFIQSLSLSGIFSFIFYFFFLKSSSRFCHWYFLSNLRQKFVGKCLRFFFFFKLQPNEFPILATNWFHQTWEKKFSLPRRQ